MALFLERISPSKLLIRVHPTSSNKEDYESLLIANIEQEFEHNLSQQIYVRDECWSIIIAAKNATIQLIRRAGMSEKTDTADKLREVVLTELMDKQAPSATLWLILKKRLVICGKIATIFNTALHYTNIVFLSSIIITLLPPFFH